MTIQEIKTQLDKERDTERQKWIESINEERRQEKLKYDKFVQSLSEGLNKARLANASIDAYYTDDLSYIYFVMDMYVLKTLLDFSKERADIMKDIISELQSENYIEELISCFLYNHNRDRLIEMDSYRCNAYYRLLYIETPDKTSPKVKLALNVIKDFTEVYYYRLQDFNRIEIPTPCKQTETNNNESKHNNKQSFLDKLISIFK